MPSFLMTRPDASFADVVDGDDPIEAQATEAVLECSPCAFGCQALAPHAAVLAPADRFSRRHCVPPRQYDGTAERTTGAACRSASCAPYWDGCLTPSSGHLAPVDVMACWLAMTSPGRSLARGVWAPVRMGPTGRGGGGNRTLVLRLLCEASPSASGGWVSGGHSSPAPGDHPSQQMMSPAVVLTRPPGEPCS